VSYLLFSGKHYYPLGGACDVAGRFSTIKAAMEAYKPVGGEQQYNEWAHVMAEDSLTIVKWFQLGEWHDTDPDACY
jgi:hypothetical protein